MDARSTFSGSQASKSVRKPNCKSPTASIDYGVRPYLLTEGEFAHICKLIYGTCGIHLKEGKQDLVKARLGRRLRTLGLQTFQDYVELVESDGTGLELAEMVDLLTTNKTEFFRDVAHFDLMRDVILPEHAGSNARLRFWCAGCSTGEEPYSVSMLVSDSLRDLSRRDFKILATDICRPALNQAAEGRFAVEELEGVPPAFRNRYFAGAEEGFVQVVPSLRKLIHFARLNLMDPWPMKGPFQLVMCRNVMIYFDRGTREKLVGRFWDLLAPGGYLMVGLSESLTGMRHSFKYVQPAVYLKA